ncbi:phage minor head protein [Mesorhizobium sp. 1M-11]|uniref:phage head morphogenesis protein n=1 Tax=Mesorhizobium sp. 1M-11 TaxID=1529006 RepID=UPI000B19EB86|nr:phage minor head protein [Mesorhizobium sp. 1M-11]
MADANISALDQPFEEAIRFFREKASVTTRTWTDVYAAAHSRAFMVAGAATDALVADFRAEILKALDAGTTIAEFRKGFDDIVLRHGWDHTGGRNWRSRIIFDTNLRTAYAAGRYAKLTAPGTLEAFPYWQYNHSGSLHPRKEHLAWDGLVLRADETFWSTNYPPNGWHCGCFVTAASDRDLRRQGKGGPDEAPDLLFRAEEVGGQRVMVPFGVDPGFEYNPGQAWLSRTAPGSETVGAAPGMIRRFVESAVAGKRPGGSYIPVAVAPRRLAGPLAVTEGTEVRLSADTIRSHQKHRHATADFYATAPELLVERGELIERADGRHMLVGNVDGDLYAAAVKIVRRAEGDELYLVSLHRTNARQLARHRRAGRILAGK